MTDFKKEFIKQLEENDIHLGLSPFQRLTIAEIGNRLINSLSECERQPVVNNEQVEKVCKCGSKEFQGHLFSEAIRCKKCKTVYTNL